MTASGLPINTIYWRNMIMAKKIKGEDGRIYVVKKPFYKKWWVWLVVILVLGIGSLEGEDATDNNADADVVSESVSSEIVADAVASEVIVEEAVEVETVPETDIPTEFRSALNKSDAYVNMMHMSKAGLYGQLTSEYGEQFSPEAAQYAIDNIQADWNENALKSAESYAETMHMSKAGIYDQLISEFGEQFTPEEAQYAIDNIVADWNDNALKKAQSYQETMSMSPEGIRDQLISDYGEKFTPEEADYAIANLN